MTDLSITETPNLLTSDIDIADSAEILRLLSKTDSEIFHGWNENSGLYDPVFLANLVHAAETLADLLCEARLAGREGRIIFSGAGTSGRIAMLLADEFSAAFEEVIGYSPLDFCIAGGNGALIKAKEGAEDDPHAGIADIEKKIPDSGIFAAVGITCGFSANYIAGQIHWTVLNKNRPAVLVGFNPAQRARAVKPENWDKSFADVISDVSGHPSMILLNPVIGPEPVTGSTRMKGGSATKIIGESLLFLILNIVRRRIRDDRNYSGQAESRLQAEQLIRGYEKAVQAFYQRRPTAPLPRRPITCCNCRFLSKQPANCRPVRQGRTVAERRRENCLPGRKSGRTPRYH